MTIPCCPQNPFELKTTVVFSPPEEIIASNFKVSPVKSLETKPPKVVATVAGPKPG